MTHSLSFADPTRRVGAPRGEKPSGVRAEALVCHHQGSTILSIQSHGYGSVISFTNAGKVMEKLKDIPAHKEEN